MTALIGLAVVILLIVLGSTIVSFHIGIASFLAAFALGSWGAGLSVDQVAGYFPSKLVITVISVTALFLMAEMNGTLAAVVRQVLRLCRGDRRWLPLILFGVTFALSAFGVGNIAATAIIAPMGMALARSVGLSYFLTSLLIVGGANAGALSPMAVTGVLVAEILEKFPVASLSSASSVAWSIFATTGLVQTLVHGVGFLALGGARWLRRQDLLVPFEQVECEDSLASPKRKLTLVLMGVFCLLVILQVMSQISVSALLVLTMAMLMRLAPTEQVIAKLPWSPILLIAGVFTLIGVVEKMGMIELASQALSQLGSGSSLYAGLALAAGGLSAFSSSSGVVLPLFLPMVPSMVQPPDPGATLELVNTIVLSAHLVDCSPLSSLGALCLASAGVSREHDKGGMFRKLLLWGFAMIPVGAVVCVVVYQIIG